MGDPIIFDAVFDEDTEEFTASFETDGVEFGAEFTGVVQVPSGEYYDGNYTVTPDAEPQTMQTRGLLMAENVIVEAIRPATTAALGSIIVGSDLEITDGGVLSVQKANAVERDNTHPITAAAVYTEVGNINALLQTI